MKSIKLSIVALFIASASFAQTKDTKTVKATAPVAAPAPVAVPAPPPAPKQSVIKWDQEMHDFGDIPKGIPATYEFTFTNNTKETILITSVKPACGCTAANYTKTPIKPGEKGTVEATFNAASVAPFQKSVTVMTNEGGVESIKTLSFKGKVIETATDADKKTDIKS
jgi:hypothetical protein